MRRFELNAEEDQFYNQCWRTLDTEGQGQVQGRACVLFFKKSNLPVDVLKKVWILSATDAQILYKQEFFIALRLIAYAQAGFELTETIIQEGRPVGLARIEGIQYQPPILQPPPQMIIPPQQSVQMSASQSSQIYPSHAEQFQSTLEQNRQLELANDQYMKYEQYYNAQDKQQTGMVPGPEARAIFEKSQLPKNMLLQIWSLVDQGQKGFLQKSEFIVAIHLISLAKRGVQIPPQLTDQLLQLIKPADSFIQPQTQRLPNPQQFQTLQPQMNSADRHQNNEISSLNTSSIMLQQKLSQQISQISNKNESDSQLIEEKKKEIEFYNSQIKKLTDILSQVNADRDQLKQQFAQLSDVANQKQQQVQQIQTQISDQLTQNQQLKQQVQQRESDSRQQSLGYQQVPAPASFVQPPYQQTQQISGFEVIGQVQNNNQVNNPPPGQFSNSQYQQQPPQQGFQQQPPQGFQQQPPQGFQQQPPQLAPQFQQQPPQLPQSVVQDDYDYEAYKQKRQQVSSGGASTEPPLPW